MILQYLLRSYRQTRASGFAFFVCLLFAPLLAGEFQSSSDTTTIQLSVPGIRSSVLARYLSRVSTSATAQNRIDALLDSLGYFAPTSKRSSNGRTVTINAGPRTSLAAITLVCPPEDSLALPSFDGFVPCPYDAGFVAAAMKRILAVCTNSGYPFAVIAVSLIPDSSRSGTSMTALLTVSPGRRCRFSDVHITGIVRTRKSQIVKDIAFAPGAWYSSEAVEQTLSRLKTRPYIEQVSALPPLLSPPRVGDSTGQAYVLVTFQVVEKSGMGLDGAVGVEAAGNSPVRPAGTLDFTLVNILGIGDRAAVMYRGSSDEQQLDISIGKTRIAGLALDLDAGFELEVHENQYGQLGGTISALLDLPGRWQGGMRANGHETTVNDASGGSWRYGGVDLVVRRLGEPRQRGTASVGAEIVTGSGIVGRQSRRYNRWHAELNARMQVPLTRQISLMGAFVSGNLVTGEDRLGVSERYRTGGYRSVRGYPDNVFAFMHRFYGQSEILWYFAKAGAVYLFLDGGVGFFQELSLANPGNRHELLGYGTGIRVPVRIGTASFEWGRNIDDNSGLGRIHVRFTNNLVTNSY